jgi:hypothetical protein
VAARLTARGPPKRSKIAFRRRGKLAETDAALIDSVPADAGANGMVGSGIIAKS